MKGMGECHVVCLGLNSWFLMLLVSGEVREHHPEYIINACDPIARFDCLILKRGCCYCMWAQKQEAIILKKLQEEVKGPADQKRHAGLMLELKKLQVCPGFF